MDIARATLEIWKERKGILVVFIIVFFLLAPIRPIQQYRGQFGFEGVTLKPYSFCWKSITFRYAYGYSIDYQVNEARASLYIFTETQFINFNETGDTTCIQSHSINDSQGKIELSLPRHGTYFLIFRNESSEEKTFGGDFFLLRKEWIPIISYLFPAPFFNI